MIFLALILPLSAPIVNLIENTKDYPIYNIGDGRNYLHRRGMVTIIIKFAYVMIDP